VPAADIITALAALSLVSVLIDAILERLDHRKGHR
jgi:hypothetical protein